MCPATQAFSRVLSDMRVQSLRMDAVMHAIMCEGFIKVKALDEATASFQAMHRLGGNTHLLPPRRIAKLLGE